MIRITNTMFFEPGLLVYKITPVNSKYPNWKIEVATNWLLPKGK